MTQLHSAPAPTGPKHRVKPTALALHVASAVSWGRPWRRRTLSLPAPPALTFQGVLLPLQPLRSWLHMLSRAGMLVAQPPAATVLRHPEEDGDVPARIEDLGFELASEMILDFTNFARQSRVDADEHQPPEAEGFDVDEPSATGTSAGSDGLHSPGMAGSVSSESVDQAFLREGTPEAQESREAASAPLEQIADSSSMHEPPVVMDEPRIVATAEVAERPVLKDRSESVAVQVEQKSLESIESAETSPPEAVIPVEPYVESLVDLPMQEVTLIEVPEVEAPVAITEMEPEPVAAAGVAAGSVQQNMAAPEIVVQLPAIEEPVEQLPPQISGTTQEPEADAPEVVAESEISIETESEGVLEVPKPTAPAIAVSQVRIGRKPVVRAQAPVERELAVEIDDRLQKASVGSHISEETAEQLQPEAAAQPELESPAVVMHWQPAEPDHAPERTQVDVQVRAPAPEVAIADEFGFEPMIASLEDALVLLAAGNAVHESTSVVPVEPVAAASSAQSDFALLAAGVQQAGGNIPEVSTLQGIFIQKETEMTEMRDESIEADAQAATAPITSVELQEVAATLSVPQLEADPDDVLSDVQSTLNSLAGMAQGLTQQKQAAGRLQEELEEWNNQLQERERQTNDKEERLRQLENHLKEAKTNLDRMAAENNRLLAERSEALKELAQSVDLRDKTTIKRAESIQLEQQRIDEQVGNLRTRASELDERESTLKRKSEELGVRLKQLQSAKDKFSTIVKSFNETVQFNSTLSAISKTVTE